ncbi:MAG TPA: NAD(P)/FAD-dependent oxidoreductase [Chromatiales bacterium]|nr:NAD(P)/FAD-dependent oxidoreductase [Thiotrichales bacterium]HIP68233.1 NAD(P)/FAD-dependent oxidoreductase [Chromatiales bacterium]
MKRITIIGAGFGALTAARELRKNNAQAKVTMIAPKPEFIYYPGLIWIPSGLRSADDLRIDLHHFFGKNNVDYFQGSVTGLKDNGRVVITDQGEVENDALIIASGGRFIKKLPGIENVITICEGISAAEKMRDQLKAMKGGTIALGFGGNPKEPSAMRGGPMFELLFGLDTQLRQEKRRDQFELIFFSPAPQPGKRLGEKAVKGLLREMEKRNIKTHLGHKMKGFESNKVLTEGGELEADMILFMPGMTGAAWFQNSGLPLSEGGMIKANAHCQVEGFEKVYVAGDSGSYPGPDWLPKQAHMADLQAATAVKNLLLELKGQPVSETFKVELICIVDTLNKGILVFRNINRTLVLPGSRIFHLLKRFFEWTYLHRFR